MAYLDFTSETGITLVHDSFKGEGRKLKLALSHVQAKRLGDALEPIRLGEQNELRVDLQGGWTLFWKRRNDDSRLLVAHPTEDTWVGTLALSPDHYAKCIEALTKSRSHSVFEDHPEVGEVSNFDLFLDLTSGVSTPLGAP